MTHALFILLTTASLWIVFGFFGQFIFFLRFIVQWIESERKHKVTIPLSFWYLSIAGTIVILIYSIHIHDIVFICAQILSFFIYVRNIVLEYKNTKQSHSESKNQHHEFNPIYNFNLNTIEDDVLSSS